jgi:sigma-E factor negative regulatory protein RseC
VSRVIATVVRATERNIWLEVERTGTCSSCSANTSCGISSLGSFLGRKNIIFKANNLLNLEKSEQVIVKYEDANLLKAVFWAYFIPVLCFFGFAILGTFLNQLGSFGTEWLSVAGAAAGLIVAAQILKTSPLKPPGLTVEGRYRDNLLRTVI